MTFVIHGVGRASAAQKGDLALSRFQALRPPISWVVLGTLALASLGCGNTPDKCCTGGSSTQVTGRRLAEDVALAVYGPQSSGHLPSAWLPEETTRRSMVRPSPTVAPRLQTQAAVAAASPRPSPYAYILGDYGAGQIFVDDVMRVDHNNVTIFYGPGPGYNSGYFAPVRIDNVFPRDEIRIVATDLYPGCKAMSPLILFREDGKNDIVVNATGIPYTCGEEQGEGVIFDQTVVIPSASPEVLIEDLKPNPESFEPQASPGSGANTTTTITADVVARNIDGPGGNYTLTIKPKAVASPAGSPPVEPPVNGKLALQPLDANPIDPPPFPSPPELVVCKFSGALNFTGDVATINDTWNGRAGEGPSPSGSFFPEGDYTIELSVTVTEQGGGQPKLAQSTTGVSIGGGPVVLEILDSNEKRLGIAVPVGTATDDQAKEERKLRKLVFPYGSQGTNNTWILKARGLPPTPESVQVKLVSSQSNVPRTVTLNLTNGVHVGNFTLDQYFIKPAPSPGTTYSITEAIFLTVAFRDLMQSSEGNAPYPLPRKQFGRFLGTLLDPGRVSDDLQASATVDNVKTGGFEAVNVSLTTAESVPRDLKTVVKVRQPATVVYIDSHGSHNGTIHLAAQTKSVTGPGGTIEDQNLVPSPVGDRGTLDTLIIDACEALDHYDYNNVHVGIGGRKSPADPLSMRFSPGSLWYGATAATTGRRHPVLLGYNTVSNEFAPQGQVFQLFGRELSRLSTESNSKSWAWMSAHYKVGSGLEPPVVPPDIPFSSGFQELALKAAAWDDGYYYYIPYKPDPDNINLPAEETATEGVFRVSLQNAIPSDWSRFPPSVADHVSIPGLP